MPVFQLLYASGALASTTADDIQEILATSRANNARLGITGMLLFANGAFIQVLEGNETDVRRLAARISNDRRHRNFMVLLEKSAPERTFGRWQMGFKELTAEAADSSAAFRTTREALDGRIGKADGGLMFDAVLAFAGREFLAT